MAKKVLHRYANCHAECGASPSLVRDLRGYVLNRKLRAARVEPGNMSANSLDVKRRQNATWSIPPALAEICSTKAAIVRLSCSSWLASMWTRFLRTPQKHSEDMGNEISLSAPLGSCNQLSDGSSSKMPNGSERYSKRAYLPVERSLPPRTGFAHSTMKRAPIFSALCSRWPRSVEK